MILMSEQHNDIHIADFVDSQVKNSPENASLSCLVKLVEQGSEEKVIGGYIEELTDSDFLFFLNSLSSLPFRHNLSQSVVDTIVTRGFLLAEKDSAVIKQADSEIMATLSAGVQTWDDFDIENHPGESITEKAFRTTLRFYRQYPFAGGQFVRQLGQECTIRPDIFVDGAVDAARNPDLQQDFLNSLQYALFYSGEYIDVIGKKIDFSKKEEYFKTGAFLELIRRLYFISKTTDFSSRNAHRIIEVIRDAVEKNKGSYLLNIRAREVLDVLSRGAVNFDLAQPEKIILDEAEEFLGIRKSEPVSNSDLEDLYDYGYLMSEPMSLIVEREFGFSAKDLSIGERFQFLNFIKHKEAVEAPPIRNFSRNYGRQGFKTFLSLEYGRELGDDLIILGETLPQPVAQRIFSKYSEIVDSAESVVVYVRDNMGGAREADAKVVTDIKDSILRKGRDLLVGFCEKVKVATANGEVVSGEEVEKELELFRADAVLFASSFKELSTRGEAPDLEQIQDVQFEGEVDGRDLSPTDVARMKELYRINYEKYPKFQQMLLDRFDSVIGDPGNRFYIFRYKGVIESYYRLGVTSLDTVYFGAFNMNPKYRGSGIGEVLMQKSLDVVAKNSVIEASCTATEAIASNYIERGFIGVSAEQVHEIYSMDIVRNDAQRLTFKSKSLSVEELKTQCASGSVDFTCQSVSLEELSRASFELLNQKTGDARNVLTRYVRDRKEGTALLVFEQVSESTLEQFSKPEHPFHFAE